MRNSDIIIKQREIGGIQCVLTASQYGQWSVYVADSEGNPQGSSIGSDDTMEGAIAKAQIQARKRKTKVKVFFRTDEGKVGFATGLHTGNGNVLVNIEGKKSQETGWGGNRTKYMKAETSDAVIADLASQKAIIKAAQEKIRQIEKKWVINLKETVIAEIDRQSVDLQNDGDLV